MKHLRRLWEILTYTKDDQDVPALPYVLVPIVVLIIVAGIHFTPEKPLGAELETLSSSIEDSKSADGTYVQVLKDGTVPDGKSFDTSKLPPNTWVNVYDGPKGKGYQVVTEYEDRTEYVGYGPYAAEYTRTEVKPVKTASST